MVVVSGTSYPVVLSVNRRRDMKQIDRFLFALRIWKDTRGQDMIEYALMAAFVAVAAVASLPGLSTSISTIFSKVGSVMASASTQS
jgi:pilus assembly protein Flp/PilA